MQRYTSEWLLFGIWLRQVMGDPDGQVGEMAKMIIAGDDRIYIPRKLIETGPRCYRNIATVEMLAS